MKFSRIALCAAVLALVVILIPAALAKGKPGGGTGGTTGGSGTISLVLLNSTDGLPHVGQKVTFDVSTTATTQPWVEVKCFQNGALVYDASNAMFPGSLNEIFTLGGTPSWPSGDADCTAYLQNWSNYAKHGTITNITSMTFHVYA
jgi:hypothetical protein